MYHVYRRESDASRPSSTLMSAASSTRHSSAASSVKAAGGRRGKSGTTGHRQNYSKATASSSAASRSTPVSPDMTSARRRHDVSKTKAKKKKTPVVAAASRDDVKPLPPLLVSSPRPTLLAAFSRREVARQRWTNAVKRLTPENVQRVLRYAVVASFDDQHHHRDDGRSLTGSSQLLGTSLAEAAGAALTKEQRSRSADPASDDRCRRRRRPRALVYLRLSSRRVGFPVTSITSNSSLFRRDRCDTPQTTDNETAAAGPTPDGANDRPKRSPTRRRSSSTTTPRCESVAVDGTTLTPAAVGETVKAIRRRFSTTLDMTEMIGKTVATNTTDATLGDEDRRKAQLLEDNRERQRRQREIERRRSAYDQVNRWTQSFQQLLAFDVGRREFEKFLQLEYSEENLLYWNACEELTALEGSPEDQIALALDIYSTFISSSGAPLSINIEHNIRRDIVRAVQPYLQQRQLEAGAKGTEVSPPPLLDVEPFVRAQFQVYMLMERDCFSRFVKTDPYRALEPLFLDPDLRLYRKMTDKPGK